MRPIRHNNVNPLDGEGCGEVMMYWLPDELPKSGDILYQKDFKFLNDMSPKDGDECICPLCNKPFHLNTTDVEDEQV